MRKNRFILFEGADVLSRPRPLFQLASGSRPPGHRIHRRPLVFGRFHIIFRLRGAVFTAPSSRFRFHGSVFTVPSSRCRKPDSLVRFRKPAAVRPAPPRRISSSYTFRNHSFPCRRIPARGTAPAGFFLLPGRGFLAMRSPRAVALRPTVTAPPGMAEKPFGQPGASIPRAALGLKRRLGRSRDHPR